jgi:hypothetical protein
MQGIPLRLADEGAIPSPIVVASFVSKETILVRQENSHGILTIPLATSYAPTVLFPVITHSSFMI